MVQVKFVSVRKPNEQLEGVLFIQSKESRGLANVIIPGFLVVGGQGPNVGYSSAF